MSFVTKLSAVALLATAAIAAPVEKRQYPDIDGDILQFALTLEHLENYFYVDALNKWPESEFVKAGFSSNYYNQLKYIAHDEEQHVIALTAGLKAAGATPVAACKYSFPYTSVKGFVGLASVIEGVGDAAYLGAAPLITSKTYLGIAGSILTTEALHTATQRDAAGEVAAANPYGSAIIPNGAYSLAAAFITSCPTSNPKLPFMAFPTLKATQGIPSAPGLDFSFSASSLPANSFVTFVNGLETISMPATGTADMIKTTIPLTVSGQTYAFLTNANTTAITDSQVVAGPAILEVTPNAPDFAIAP